MTYKNVENHLNFSCIHVKRVIILKMFSVLFCQSTYSDSAVYLQTRTLSWEVCSNVITPVMLMTPLLKWRTWMFMSHKTRSEIPEFLSVCVLWQTCEQELKWDFASCLLKHQWLHNIFLQLCCVDRPEEGGLSPYVFALMVIFFLQQRKEPFLPVYLGSWVCILINWILWVRGQSFSLLVML